MGTKLLPPGFCPDGPSVGVRSQTHHRDTPNTGKSLSARPAQLYTASGGGNRSDQNTHTDIFPTAHYQVVWHSLQQ